MEKILKRKIPTWIVWAVVGTITGVIIYYCTFGYVPNISYGY